MESVRRLVAKALNGVSLPTDKEIVESYQYSEGSNSDLTPNSHNGPFLTGRSFRFAKHTQILRPY